MPDRVNADGRENFGVNRTFSRGLIMSLLYLLRSTEYGVLCRYFSIIYHDDLNIRGKWYNGMTCMRFSDITGPTLTLFVAPTIVHPSMYLIILLGTVLDRNTTYLCS